MHETKEQTTDCENREATEKTVEKAVKKTTPAKTSTWKKVLFRMACVILSLTFLYFLQALLCPKYMSNPIEGALTAEYYAAYGDHDVLFVGDCEVYENFSTITLWEEYGINSFIRGGAQQLTWQSYYMLEDALRYETPDVVVFNVLALKYNEPQKEEYNRMALDGMRWSKTKVDAISASMCEDESMIEYIFPILRYHSRWNELTSEDFQYLIMRDNISYNGYYMRTDILPVTDFPPAKVLPDYTFGDNAMAYLDKMRTLCEEKGIAFVLIKSTSLYPHWYDEWDAQIVEYAEKYDLHYINMAAIAESEIGIDYQVDTYDAGLHMNVTGAEKCASYLGARLKEWYDLEDHRNDPEMSAYWDNLITYYEEEKNL